MGACRMRSMSQPTGVPLAQQIETITDNGSGGARVTTVGQHGLEADNSITISGSSVPGYDQLTTVAEVIDVSIFDTTMEYTEDATGGVWTPG